MNDLPRKSEYIVNKMVCPDCGYEEANIVTHLLDIPHYDDFMMIAINCPECKFRTSDFFNADTKDHIISTYKVENEKDMRTKVVRATDGIVSIPELGVTIDPVSGSSTWIRNIEGILVDILEKIELALDNLETDEERQEALDRIALIQDLIDVKVPFTITVEDQQGNSIILPEDESKLIIEKL
ncbi:MAG: ZPR1 zinc finger domain-containing protein [Candidatus Heimdallarchaeota archaeon]|nr:ZPR1 zinc finger domain-containing protein [Candidatus Heimdallarchaeota archaeon]